MRRFRTTIAGLLGLVALVGVAIAGLIYPSTLAANAFYTLTLFALLLAVLAAVYLRGDRKAFWVGFATCGWAYFLMVFGPQPFAQYSYHLITTTILHVLYPWTVPPEHPAAPPGLGAASTIATPSAPLGVMPWPATQPGRRVWAPRILQVGGFNPPPSPPQTSWEIWTAVDRSLEGIGSSPRAFQTIGHSLFCLAFATAGGFLTRRIRKSRDRDDPPMA